MRLYFLRHGLAGNQSDWKGDDFDRPLTEEGKERMARQAATLVKLELEVDSIITSPLVRAFQTAEIVAKKMDLLDRLVKDERLSPGFNPSRLALVVKSYPQANALILVGHEPDMSLTISHLIGGGRLVCKKGSFARVDIPSPTSLKGELVWLATPKILGL